MEDANNDHHLVLYVTFQDGIVVTWMTQIPHLEILGLQIDIRSFFCQP